MAPKIPPALLNALCPLRYSRIPHLLAALSSKHNQIRAPLPSRRHQSATSRALPPLRRSPSRPPPAQAGTTSPPQPSPRDKWALYIASLFGFSFALYLSFVYVGVRKDLERSQLLLGSGALSTDGDVSDRWNAIGRNYDDEIDLAEKMMFMGRKRRRLVGQARGEVLEVSVGTGRNMQYYDLSSGDEAGKKEKQEEESVTGMVFNDKASVMVDAARKKFEELEGRKMPAQRFKGRVQYVVGDAGVRDVIKKATRLGHGGPGGGFDTIVQTMGLCSTRDPVGFLKRLGELCRKPSGKGKAYESSGVAEQVKTKVAEGKYGNKVIEQKDEEYDGGRILLLEHGRGHYDWLNKVLDGLAPAHADHYGCWWNRDIGRIVEESGLEIEYIKRYHIGTTWEVVLRPKREEEVGVAAESDSQEDKNSGMFGWMSKATNRVAEAISRR